MTVIDIVIDGHLGHQAQADSPPYAGNQRLTPVKRDGWGLRATVCVSETLKTTIFKVAASQIPAAKYFPVNSSPKLQG